jgi:hypothetical protein
LTKSEMRAELAALHDRKYGPVSLPRNEHS